MLVLQNRLLILTFTMKKLLSGNEALALGAYHAGVMVAAAYPGTPSTEILASLAGFDGIHAEWSTNEQVAMAVGLGAAYTGVRSVVSLKQVGLNVASDAFMAASTTGVSGGMVVICADDPGIHSSQDEQDNRHYAVLAKVPMLEPSDSQEAYDLMAYAFDISEQFDTPVLVRTTTRISHSRSVVSTKRERPAATIKPAFRHDMTKYVLLPTTARLRRPIMEERLKKLAEYTEAFTPNQIISGERSLGIISSGVAYQYAREVLPEASFLKLTMTYPLPQRMIREFAAQVDRLLVVEELDPFLEQNIRAMGIELDGKEFIPRIGELNPGIIATAAQSAGILPGSPQQPVSSPPAELPRRPPLLCAGCPHMGIFYVLSTLGQRARLPRARDKAEKPPKLIVSGDIGCYTLAAYPPLKALDTTGCMGASIGEALGMEKAGIESNQIVAVIGDSTFMHAGISGLVNAVYNQSRITVIILDNRTTAMTGHQGHPGSGISARGEMATEVELERLVRGIGVNDVRVISAFEIKALRSGVRQALDNPELSVIIVRGNCPILTRARSEPRTIDSNKCDQCGTCLLAGCPAIQRENERIYIDTALCIGASCTICEQICARKAIRPLSSTDSGAS